MVFQEAGILSGIRSNRDRVSATFPGGAERSALTATTSLHGISSYSFWAGAKRPRLA